MHSNPPRQRFGAKKVGWGFSPRTWEGWVATAAIAAALIALLGLVTG